MQSRTDICTTLQLTSCRRVARVGGYNNNKIVIIIIMFCSAGGGRGEII